MSLDKDLQDAFVGLTKRDADTFPAIVVSVDKEKGICIINDGVLEFTDVRLSSIIDENQNKIYLFPKEGSSVLISKINNDIHALYIAAYSEIEEYYLKIEASEFNVDHSGILIKKGEENLQLLMLDLIRAIKQMKFTTNTGSTLKLVNILDFEKLEPRFKQLLKDN
ncbi:hypothetical protein HX001_00135 [Empedobacter brevis]|uniref:Uncharacterized protein n=1 Tax=Empedobacter brevis TaxID=247 RepID=A0AAJ1QB33_9FLAO|nr:hypothetical protein [Empedobacter brevis]MDM1070893.1 hypothetical protein [Empedobacter brevis]